MSSAASAAAAFVVGDDLSPVGAGRAAARIGVHRLWLGEFDARVVSVHRLESGAWSEVLVAGDGTARLPPFDDVEIDVGAWWRDPSAPP